MNLKMRMAIEYARSHQERFLQELKDLIAIPSISSSPPHKNEVRRCAEFLKTELLKLGLIRAEIFETPGHPVVYGEWIQSEDSPTLLIYGHYDVQPVDPLELWDSLPFEMTQKEGRIYGRGTADDKGQIFIHCKAIQSWLKTVNFLPLNIKIILEGEEEIGSPNLDSFLNKHRQLLEADVALISDTSMFEKGLPSICYGLRGLAYFQINVRSFHQDLHSGSFGGAVKNPIQALGEILNKLKGEQGRVCIEGFYDDVVEISREERELLNKLPFHAESFREQIGAKQLYFDDQYSVLENLWCRPSLEACGIWGGFVGEGSKTIIPAEAHAKVNVRLVPKQTPEKIGKLFQDYIMKIAPPEVEVSVEQMHGGLPFVADFHHPVFTAGSKALKKGFGVEPVLMREGGSIPFVRTLYDVLKVPCLLIGFGLPNQNIHSPNEWFDLENFQKGILTSIYLYEELSKAL